MTQLDDTMSENIFTMLDPSIFAAQTETQHLELLYQQALKAHGKTLALRDTISGLQAQALQASEEKVSQNQMLAEAMHMLRDATSTHEWHPSLSTGGEVKVNTKQPRVAAPHMFSGDSEQVDQFLADCWLDFNGNTAYTADIIKITFALSYMKDGSTSQWANNVVLDMQTQDATRSYSTWETFLSSRCLKAVLRLKSGRLKWRSCAVSRSEPCSRPLHQKVDN
jgi:hypothetical protein